MLKNGYLSVGEVREIIRIRGNRGWLNAACVKVLTTLNQLEEKYDQQTQAFSDKIEDNHKIIGE